VSRVVVVGGGVGGLAAAARLAALGHAVTLCEQADRVGGKLGWVSVDPAAAAGRFGFDTGPSLLTLPQVFLDLFADTGAPLDSVLRLERTTLPRCRFPDGTTLAPATTDEEFLATLGDAAPQWAGLMRRAERIWAATRVPFLESPLGSLGALVRLLPGQLRDLRTVAPWQTLRGLGRSYLREENLRMLLDRYATYSGSDPRRAPAALAVVPYVEQRFGAWYVPGGLYQLAVAIAHRAVERGAVVRTSTDVVAIERNGSRVSGVRLADGGRLPADVVVANADAAHLYRDLVDVPRIARAARSRASYGGLVLLLAVRGRTPGLAHHEVVFPADYDREFDELRAGAAPLRDPTVYLSVPADPAAAPAGCESWFVLVNAPRQGQVDWDLPGRAEAAADAVLATLARREPGLDVRGRVLWRAVHTPADLARGTRAYGGAIYGTSSDGARAAFLRPANRSPVPGLFLVGGSAHPGGGLPLVALSARIVAGLVGPA